MCEQLEFARCELLLLLILIGVAWYIKTVASFDPVVGGPEVWAERALTNGKRLMKLNCNRVSTDVVFT